MFELHYSIDLSKLNDDDDDDNKNCHYLSRRSKNFHIMHNNIAHSYGVHWVHVHHPRAEKKCWGQIYRGKL